MSDETAIENWNSNSAFRKALAACRVICPDVVCHCIYVAFGSRAALGSCFTLVGSSPGSRPCGSPSEGRQRAISGREQCDPGQSILVAPIAGRYDEAGDRDRVAIAGARWDL
jgi:hypothetical protein